MPKHFDLEIRKSPREKFLKVFVADIEQLDALKVLLESLPSVRRVNITKSQSTSSPEKNLTVYPSRVYEISEVVEQVRSNLDCYFLSNPIDPIFKDETISSISEIAFKQIVSLIQRFGHNLEKYPCTFSKFKNEEEFRTYFLPYLNSLSMNHSATGETFNKYGKTDFLIQDSEGNNVFIGEFKIWYGPSELQKAVDQLIERYVSWRDEHTALIVINKINAGFSDVVSSAIGALKAHKLYKSLIARDSESSALFEFHNLEDRKKLIKLELILFNYYTTVK